MAACWFFLIHHLVGYGKVKRVYVFDIDNTLADTWPSYLKKHTSEKERLEQLPVFTSMRNFVVKCQQHSENRVVFLTHRSVLTFGITMNWLRKNKMNCTARDLVIVGSPSDKIDFIYRLSSKYKVRYIDDLSYNHEIGEIKYYSTIIDQVKKMPIRYYSKAVIDRFNSSKKNVGK
jgi:FMN phosphatase YigB (HAD superfamily)